MPETLNWATINPKEDFVYGQPRAGQTNGFSVSVDVMDRKDGRSKPFIFQTPILSLPFGLQEKEMNGAIRRTAAFSFPTVRMVPGSNEEFTGEESVLNFLLFLRSVEEHNIDKAHLTCKTWFKKEYARPLVEELYFRGVYLGEKVRSGEYPPTFSTKINADGGRMDTKFFEFDEATRLSTPVDYASIPKNVRMNKCIALIGADRMWFAGKQFGMSFRVYQLAIFKEDRFEGCAINFGLPPPGEEDEARSGDDYRIDYGGDSSRQPSAVVDAMNL